MKMAKMILSAALFVLPVLACVAQTNPQFGPLDQALSDSIFHGDVAGVNEALQHGANIEYRDENGDTPLLDAVRVGNTDIVKLLLENHANMDAKNHDSITPLSLAVLRHEPDMVMLLLANHANIEAKDSNGATPLIQAAYEGNVDIVKLLLENGANRDAKDSSGVNALSEAAYKTNCDVVVLLDAVPQQKTAACMQRLLAWYKKEPTDYLAKKAIQTAVAMNPRPEVAQEARRPFVQANTLYKTAQSDADMKAVLDLYKQALLQAPWFADAWYNQSLTQEKVGDYKGALASMKNFELLEPGGDKDQATLDRIYALEARAK